MVTTDEDKQAAADRRQHLDQRWNQASASLWTMDAQQALRLDRTLHAEPRQFLRALAAGEEIFVRSIQGLARLAFDELCETPDPRHGGQARHGDQARRQPQEQDA